jgi:hypothetical protein
MRGDVKQMGYMTIHMDEKEHLLRSGLSPKTVYIVALKKEKEALHCVREDDGR